MIIGINGKSPRIEKFSELGIGEVFIGTEGDEGIFLKVYEEIAFDGEKINCINLSSNCLATAFEEEDCIPVEYDFNIKEAN